MSDGTSNSEIIAGLAEEFVERYRRGERPAVSEYTAQHPELAEEIREFFAAVAMVENLAPAESESFGDAGSDASSTTLPALKQLGDFRIIREVGRGGMGVVYEAEQVSLGRHVALKVLPAAALPDDKHIRRFEREAKSAAKLHHTNIVPVFGVGAEQDLHYYVMQFIQGLPLDEVIEELKQVRAQPTGTITAPVRTGEGGDSSRQRSVADVARSLMTGQFAQTLIGESDSDADSVEPAGEPPNLVQTTTEPTPQPGNTSSARLSETLNLSGSSSGSGVRLGKSVSQSSQGKPFTYWQSVANIGLQVADAMQYAHDQGILHRDIKPSNLLLDMRGTAWVTDFGLAKATDQQDITHTGDILGTLRYMPPEAFEGIADSRSDVYSLGLTLYELLCFQPAFGMKDRNRLVKQVTTEAAPRLEKLNPEIPRDLVTIIHKAIDRDPSHRYQNARELQEDLQRFLDDEPIRARRISTTERFARWSRRNKGLAASLAVVCLLLLIINIAGPVMMWQVSGLNDELEGTVTELQEREQDLLEQGRELETETQRANTEAEREKAAREEADQTLYATDMQLAAQIWRDNEATAAEVRDRLNAHVPAYGEKDRRGFEWYYHDYLVNHSATIFRHSADVFAAAITADDDLITLDLDFKLRRWDRTTRNEIATTDLQQSRDVGLTALSPDGTLVALAVGNTIHIVDTATAAELRQLDSDTGFTALTFSGDARTLVTVNGTLDRIQWWDATTGEQRAVEDLNTVRRPFLSLSRDGRVLAVAHGQYLSLVSIYRLDPTTNNVTSHAEDFNGTLGTGALSPDGRLFAMSSFADGGVSVYETDDFELVTSNSGAHASPPTAMLFSDDGERLITAARDGTVRIWPDARNLEESPRTLKGHEGPVHHLFLSLKQDLLVSSGADDTTRVWDLTRPDPSVHTLAGVRSQVYDAEFSPDGLLVAVTDGPDVGLQDAATGQRVRVLHGREGDAYSLAFAPDGALLAVGYGNDDGEKSVSHVLLWDIDAGQQVARLNGVSDIPGFTWDENNGTVAALAFSPDGRYLVAGFGRPTLYSTVDPIPLKVWEVATRRLIARLEGHHGHCVSLDFSADGELLASCSYGGTARIWSTRTWQTLYVLENPDPVDMDGDHEFADVAFSPDGGRLAVASDEGSVVLWDFESGSHEMLAGHQALVQAVAFSPDGRTLASSSADDTVRLWNMETRRQILRLRAGDANALAFSPDGRQLLSAGWVDSIRSAVPELWDDPDHAAERLSGLLDSSADFQSRIRMLSENLRIHEALQVLVRERRGDPDVEAALAATRANWFAKRQQWRMASLEFDRLIDLSPDAADWLRTPGLLRLATALLHEQRPQDAAILLTGGAQRRTEDGIDAVVTMVGLGINETADEDAIRIEDLLPGSPADGSNLQVGDVILQVNGAPPAGFPIPELLYSSEADAGVVVRLTVQHPRTEQTEEIELVTDRFRYDSATGDLLHPLLAAANTRLELTPRNAGLLELRAELAGQWGGRAEQVADYTAAIESLTESSGETGAQLARLYRRRGDAHLALNNWQAAKDDHARADEAPDEELSAQQALAEANLLLGISTLVPTSEVEGVTWRYTTREPAETWAQPGFDDSSWSAARGPFGRTLLSPGNSDAWLRHEFEAPAMESPALLFLLGRYDETLDVFLNGQPIAHRQGPTDWQYVVQELEQSAAGLLAPGSNTLAVHCRNTEGAGYVDVGLFAAHQPGGSLPALLAADAIDDPWLKLAAAYRLGDNQPALDQLVGRHPQLAGPVGDLFAADEDWEGALAFYGLAITEETTDPELLSSRARAYEQLADWAAAAADWERAAAGSPNGATLLAEFGKRLAEQGRAQFGLGYLSQARQLLELALAEDPGSVIIAEQLIGVLLEDTTEWTVLEPSRLTSAEGATLTPQADGSILAGGPHVSGDVYTIRAPVGIPEIRTLRLETLPDASLPRQGPGRHSSGNFQLKALRVFTASGDDGEADDRQPIANAWASFEYRASDAAVVGTINESDPRVWHVFGRHGERHVALFEFVTPLSTQAGQSLIVECAHHDSKDAPLNLGRFRLSVTDDPAAFDANEGRVAVAGIEDPWVRLGAAYAALGDPTQAAEWFATALERTPEFAARRELVERIDELHMDLGGLLALRPDDLLLLSAQANRLLAAGQAEAATEVFARARTLTEALLTESPDDEALAGFLADLLLADTTEWTVLEPSEMTSDGGATLKRLDDNSILSGGPNVAGDVYRIRTRINTPGMRAIRLEALPDPSLPNRGPGTHSSGNFQLAAFRVFAVPEEGVELSHPLKVTDARASYHYDDGGTDLRGGTRVWHVWGRFGERHAAVYELATPLQPGQPLMVQLRHRDAHGGINLGRFRLSVTDAPDACNRLAVASIKDPWARLYAAYDAAGESTLAAKWFARAFEQAPGFAARVELVEQIDEFETILADLVVLHPDDPVLWSALAKRQAADGRPEAAAESLARARSLTETLLKESPDETLADFLVDLLLPDTTDWTVLVPENVTSENGTRFTTLDDNSVLAGGPHPEQDVYTVTTRAADLQNITAIRLEALTDETLPGEGPGRYLRTPGEFVLNRFQVTAGAQQTPDSPVEIVLDAASADLFYPPVPIAPDSIWHLGTQGGGSPHMAVYRVRETSRRQEGSGLKFEMTFNNQGETGLQLGRFRLSVTDDPAAFELHDRRFEIARIDDHWLRVGAAYAAVGDTRQSAEWFARALERASGFAARTALVEQIKQHQTDLDDLLVLRRDDPLLLEAVARRQQADGRSEAAAVSLDRARGLTEILLSESPHDETLAGFLADLLLADSDWTVLDPVEMTSDGGATLTPLSDGSILADGPNADADVYTIWSPVGIPEIRAVRLEALPDPSFPYRGPGRRIPGDFALRAFRLFVPSIDDGELSDPLPIANAWASFEGAVNKVLGTINDSDSRTWYGQRNSGERHAAIFELATPLRVAPGQPLIVQCVHSGSTTKHAGPNIGRFRLSVTDSADVVDSERRRWSVAEIDNPWARLGAASAAFGDATRAAEWLSRALERAPDFAARRELVRRIDQPQTDLARLVALRPDDPLLLSALANRRAAAGESEAAAELLIRARMETEALLAESPADESLAGFLADLLLADTTRWSVLKSENPMSAGGATLATLDDSSVLASGPNPDHDLYTITAATDLQNITAIRLEALTDDSLPGQGPGRGSYGRFVMDRMRLTTAPQENPDSAVDVTLDAASADFFFADRLITPNGAWHVAAGPVGQPHVAIYRLGEQIQSPEGSCLTFEMTFNHGSDFPGLNLGRFRLSVTDDPVAFETNDRRFAVGRIEDPWVRLATAYADLGESTQAAEWFARALERAPDFAARRDLVEQIDASEIDLDALVALRPDEPLLWSALVKRQTAAGQTEAAAESLARARSLTEAELAESPDDEALAGFLADLLLVDTTRWTVLKPSVVASEGDSTLTTLEDHSILAGGPNPEHDLYSVTTEPIDLQNITAIRLEALTDDSLPSRGPGRFERGRFSMTRIRVAAASRENPETLVDLKLDAVSADYFHRHFLTPNGRWLVAVGSGAGRPCTAIYRILREQVESLEDSSLRFDMAFSPGTNSPGRNLGRFRLSVTDDPTAFETNDRRYTLSRIEDPWARLYAAYTALGESAKANEWFAKALDGTPDFAARRESVERIDQPETDLDALLALRPDDPLLLRAQAERQSAAGQTEEAAASFARARSLTEALLAESPDDEALAGFLSEIMLSQQPTSWTVLQPREIHSENGEQFTAEDDGSLFVSGPNPDRAVYTIRSGIALPAVSCLRIESLPDERLPHAGAGRYAGHGNFHLSELSVAVAPTESGGDPMPVEIAGITADDQNEHVPANMIDGDPATRWSVYPRQTSPHEVLVSLKTPVQSDQGDLVITLDSGISEWGQHGLGRFRLSVTDDPGAFDQYQSRLAALTIEEPWLKLAAAYYLTADEPALDALLHRNPQAAVGIENVAGGTEAIACLDRVMNALAENAAERSRLLRLRAALHVRAGQWDRAAADYAENVELDPAANSVAWMVPAAMWAYAGDAERHREWTRNMAERFRASGDAPDAERTLKVMLLMAHGFDPEDAPVEPVLAALAGDALAPAYRIWFLSARALLACRSGEFDEAQRDVDQSLQLAAGVPRDSISVLFALSVQSLIHARQGNMTAAQAAVDELKTLLASRGLAWTEDGTLDGSTTVNAERIEHDLLISEILRREAERLIQHAAAPREQPAGDGEPQP